MKRLSEKLKYWRAERPDEWTMDEFIRDAQRLEDKLSTLLSLHDSEVFTRSPWDETFEEVRKLLGREGGDHVGTK